MEPEVFEVVEVHNITDTLFEGTYDLDVTLRINGIEERFERYISTPDCPYGANPAVRLWMSQNPDAQVHPYIPPTIEQVRAALPPLSARQLRLGLVAGGFTLAQVSAVIDAMPEGAEKETARIEWEYATTFNRTHPLIASVGGALGLTDEQIDAMWTAALGL
ncbi:conserved hypothetical protein [Sinorhizobium fredii HH103]|uniref:Uncharacterized protein n=1 Tax=Sinorhizobium fredii (strain HH103) TaxID=1117943 RepID=G9AA64_SINF1|nr:hypothetical protein [Sinorhizobium fredii]CCE94655.1 conserved hypothetical protein [Sinorhizobium fredii HH103]